MYPVVLSSPTQAKVIPFENTVGVLTHIQLNYDEHQCIELALIGLTEIIRHNDMLSTLTNVSVDHLYTQRRYLMHWLNQPMLTSQLRFDGKNRVWWPFASSELVDWLLWVCQFCINEDAILIAAADAASDEYAEWTETVLTYLDHHSLAKHGYDSNFSQFQRYYNGIVARYQTSLIEKLAAIQAQDYPLYPRFSVLD